MEAQEKTRGASRERKSRTKKLAGTVNWGTTTMVGVFAGMLYGGSKEASTSVLNDSLNISTKNHAGTRAQHLQVGGLTDLAREFTGINKLSINAFIPHKSPWYHQPELVSITC
ncbi:mitochondrial import inner membrane translocase [Striga asiatica]|uniref:Mitochondrial import inner membrane translocase n=1 Tax=Striga asiatica TaxID=4170 RepID=A0A5A7P433_STRAF|nr:mitochondrial import inner membrane translocase [Striga asiatica]